MGAESMVEQRGYRAGPEIRLITDSRRVEHRQNRQRAIWKNNAEGDDKPLADSVVGLGIVQEWRAADRRRKRRHLFEANPATNLPALQQGAVPVMFAPLDARSMTCG